MHGLLRIETEEGKMILILVVLVCVALMGLKWFKDWMKQGDESMTEWTFSGIWYLDDEEIEVECTVEAYTEQQAREKAFEVFMNYRKNMGADKATWIGMHLMYYV